MKERILREIDRLVRQFGTRNPYELADYLDLHLVKRTLPKGIVGVVAEVLEEKYILLDAALPDEEARYIVAHEIYHHIDNHPDYFSTQKGYWGNLYERGPDYFAAGLLIEEEPEWGETIMEFSARIGVPLKLVRIWHKDAA
ncbi:ImmA/IrrE family metallo-endopeptidase [Desulfotomaculum nigrificans]|uniref:ImmA/IrrE family metallo-endopeptidase n=1 Tax=Desulfotomaculum nigrificans TaxID=1565 RepID=UPI0001FAE545|nr:ImmA/IrrE family metallo-endopeptidase [Desulfotomaculum nigrificans]